MNFVIVDIETTGGSPKNSKITEIAIYKHNGTEIIDEYITLINPEIKIPAFIINLTGINDQMVRNAPKFYEVAKDIVAFTEDCIFVAHNVGFDYGVLREEFRSLGYDYRRPHLCTVRAARYVIPGHDSYSLGKLSRNLGIAINGRHRAGGDAFATTQLFAMLYAKDVKGLNTFIQMDINPRILHPNLDLEHLETIPNKTGVYKFYDEFNRLIYIGKSIHIRKRIDQHLKNSKTKKGAEMAKEVARIEFEVTGSELIALLRESELIKLHRPLYNRSLTRSSFPYGLFYFTDTSGYIQFFIDRLAKTKHTPLATFVSRKEATNYLERIVSDYNLCQKLCALFSSDGACFHYGIRACSGACIKEESPASYNKRAHVLLDKLTFNNHTFYVVDKGRERSERSLIFIENGILAGVGYAPYHFKSQPVHKWQKYLELIRDDRDARTILNLFMRKNTTHEVVSILQ